MGEMVANLVTELKGFNADEEEDKGIFGWFKRGRNKIEALKARYDEVEVNVNSITSAAGNPPGYAAQRHRPARSAL